MKILGILPAVKVWKKNEKYFYDRKFYDGVREYCKYWKGEIRCFMQISEHELPKFGVIEHNKATPFSLEIVSKSEKDLINIINDTNVLLISGESFDYLNAYKILKDKDIKIFYLIENTFKNRIQLAKIENNSIFTKMFFKTFIYLVIGEYKRIRSFKKAIGLQANGVGAFNFYKKFNKNCLLYFDTRIRKSDLIKEEQLSNRLKKMQYRELHIGFSGRLTAIKGVNDLITVAKILRTKNISFKLYIYGDGDQYAQLYKQILDNNLLNYVILKGALSFYDELVPELKENIDLFILPHKQGDPSCTYMETLSCGIPIIGYNNEAFEGLMQIADIGWIIPMSNVEDIANKIEELSNTKNQIINKSKNAIKLAKENYFEKTFENRVKHLLRKV